MRDEKGGRVLFPFTFESEVAVLSGRDEVS